MDLFNIVTLSNPSHDVCEYSKKDAQDTEDIASLITILTNAANKLGPDHLVWKEIQVFQALQFRLASKLPCDKFLHLFESVGHCIKKFVLLDLAKLYLDLAEGFLTGIKDDTEKINLPSRQQLEYLLIRTQGSAKLLCRTLNYAEDTFSYLLKRLSVGHLLQSMLMACSVVARISVMYKALLVQICGIYMELKNWRSKLKKGVWQWPRDLNLPDNLLEWLKPERPEIYSTSVPPEQKTLLNRLFNKSCTESPNAPLFNDDNDDDIMIVDEVTQKVNDKPLKTSNTATYCNGSNNSDNELEFIQQKDDFGEVISRHTQLKSHKSTNKDNVPATQELKSALLLKIIMETETLKALQLLWNQLCTTESPFSAHAFSLKLPAKKKKKINSIFVKYRKKSAKLKKQQQNLTSPQKRKQMKELLSIVKKNVAVCLGLCNNQKSEEILKDQCMENTASKINAVKPVRTLQKLKYLYKHLENELPESVHDIKKQLFNLYKRGYEDANVLKQENWLKLSGKLIFRTSKKMISLCKGYLAPL